MMSGHIGPAAIVVTSIASPNHALRELARGSKDRGFEFIVIGDTSSPLGFALDGCDFYSLRDQTALEFELARQCPTRLYARKNIGYLVALRNGAELIVETDDDNIPDPQFWLPRERRQRIRILENAGWINAYRYFTDEHIWPRGLPLTSIRALPQDFDALPITETDCPIQQGLVDRNPDVDAIYRLTLPLPQSFRRDRRIALAAGVWCPFNSQNTSWWRDAAPLLYLPASCSFRMTDIWRSLIAQRVAWECGWAVLFHEPTVHQERNEHDLMRDFADELPGYLNNAAIADALGSLPLKSGIAAMMDNIAACYEQLVRMKLIDRGEMQLIKAWFDDLRLAGI
jgi:hypothetical protein